MSKDASFDITTSVDLQEVDNAVNQAAKEVAQRYDFKDARLALIEGAAHWVHHDKLDEFVAKVTAFFDEVPLKA